MLPSEQHSLDDLLACAHRCADLSETILKQSFRQSSAKAELKSDQTPVTKADRAVEAAIRAMIREHYPDHGIIGEEAERERVDAPYQWIIDPIDGTRAFACGIPTFTTLIGLLYQQQPLLGIINQPIAEERWSACDSATVQAMLNGAAITSNQQTRTLHQAKLATTSPYLFAPAQQPIFERVREATAIQNYGGDAYNYALLASGHIDLIIEAGLKPYDILPILPILTHAGACFSDWSGQPLDYSADMLHIVVSANEALHSQVIAAMNAA